MKDGGISEFEGREFAKQTMIDYDGNKKMFVNDQAVVDYDNFMKEKSILLEENEDEKNATPRKRHFRRKKSHQGKP